MAKGELNQSVSTTPGKKFFKKKFKQHIMQAGLGMPTEKGTAGGMNSEIKKKRKKKKKMKAQPDAVAKKMQEEEEEDAEDWSSCDEDMPNTMEEVDSSSEELSQDTERKYTPKSTGKTVNDTQQSTKKTKSAPNSDKKKKKKLQNGRVSSGFSKLHII
ncbi:hypothetical protein NP493_77g04025 [Ridgeia piscesae]|uniref:Uncharacterized protein n=1 Tax=Ridgeia piscesae TaxID=27915 RepID=A0AAD9P9M5_RIDPI|nr:hypothetical protein NP493_77g04025 [Ridgeia piscesae]